MSTKRSDLCNSLFTRDKKNWCYAMSNAVTHCSYYPVSQAGESMKVIDENQALLDANIKSIVEK